MSRSHKTYSTWQRRKAVPQVKLSGQWLHAAGLSIDTPFTVHITPDQIILTPSKPL